MGDEGGHFHGGDEEAMAEFFEMTAATAGGANRAAEVDGVLEGAIDVVDGVAHGLRCGEADGGGDVLGVSERKRFVGRRKTRR